MAKIKNSTLGWIICSLAAIFYCYEYLLRISPAVMVKELMQTFQANATEIGILSAFFYFIYTPMQILVGILLDLYGPRLILTVAVTTCALGSYLFGIAPTFAIAAIGRSLIGFGSAFAFVCVLKLAAIWLPQRFFGLFVGLTNTLGMIGGMFGVVTLSSLVHRLGWKETVNMGTITGIILIPLIWFIIKDNPRIEETTHKHGSQIKPHHREIFSGFFRILKNHQMWLNGFIGCLMYLSLALFAELWGIPFLSTLYKISTHDAGIACSWLFFGWLVGSPLIGYISDMYQNRRIPISLGCLFSTILIALIIYLPPLSIHLLYALLFLFGVFSGFEILCFAISSENNPKHLIATASAFTNFLIMIGGIAAQPLIGKILDATWSGQTLDQIRVYSIYNYRLALTVLPIAFFVGFVLTFWLKETGNKK